MTDNVACSSFFFFFTVSVRNYLDVEQAILEFLLQVKRIVEELKLHNRFGGEPATIDLLDTIYHTERVHVVAAFIITGYLPWIEMRLPATNMHIL